MSSICCRHATAFRSTRIIRCRRVDRYSFRGAFLDDAREELGPLLDDAYRYMSRDQHEDYGERLMSCARRFARKRRIMEIELVKGLPEYEEGSVEARAHIMFAAARWWSRRGHGLAPWF